MRVLCAGKNKTPSPLVLSLKGEEKELHDFSQDAKWFERKRKPASLGVSSNRLRLGNDKPPAMRVALIYCKKVLFKKRHFFNKTALIFTSSLASMR